MLDDLATGHDVDPVRANEHLAGDMADLADREDRLAVRDGELPVRLAGEHLLDALADEREQRPAVGVIDDQRGIALAGQLTLEILDERGSGADLADEDDLVRGDAADQRAGGLLEPVEHCFLAKAADLRCTFYFKQIRHGASLPQGRRRRGRR